MTQSHRGKGAWIRLAATLPVIAAVFLAFGCGVKSEAKAEKTATNLTSDRQEPLTFRIHVAKSKDEKGIIKFQNDRATSYEDYTKAMKLITTAYKELREEVSAEVFGKPLAELSDTETQVIYRAVPMNVSEMEPHDVPARK